MLLPHTVVASWWVFTGTTTANCPVHGNGNGNGNQNGGNGNGNGNGNPSGSGNLAPPLTSPVWAEYVTPVLHQIHPTFSLSGAAMAHLEARLDLTFRALVEQASPSLGPGTPHAAAGALINRSTGRSRSDQATALASA